MSPTDLRVLLLRKGIRQAEIARAYGCVQSNVHAVIEGRSKSKGLRHFIAAQVDEPVEKLWPDMRSELVAA